MIYPECNPEYILLKVIGVFGKNMLHASGKGEVCNELKDTTYSKGLVDEDPNSSQPSYVKELKLDDSSGCYDIKILHDQKRNNILFVLCPRLESWILKSAQESKVDVTKYSFPNDWKKLHKMISKEKMNTRTMRNWEDLMGELKRKSERVKTLAKLVRESKL